MTKTSTDKPLWGSIPNTEPKQRASGEKKDRPDYGRNDAINN